LILLKKTLEEEATSSISEDKSIKTVDISELEHKYRIKNMSLFINASIVLGVVILLFFLSPILGLGIDLAWIAVLGAMVLLLISNLKDIESVLEKVEWGTLLFFAALFILMRGLEELGLISYIGDLVTRMIRNVPAGKGRLAVAVTLIVWISAIVSAFIDNIPYTAAMIPVVYQLATSDLGLPLTPLVWSLVFGTCFGGNGTLIGASANVVCAGISEHDGYPISFNTFFKLGFPTMIVTVFIAHVYMLIFHVAIPWY